MTRRKPPDIPERVLREAWIAYAITRNDAADAHMPVTRAAMTASWRKFREAYLPSVRAAAAVILAWERERKGEGR